MYGLRYLNIHIQTASTLRHIIENLDQNQLVRKSSNSNLVISCVCVYQHTLSQFQPYFWFFFGAGHSNGRKISQLFWESNALHCFSHSSALPLFKPLQLRQSVFQPFPNLGSKLTGAVCTLSSCICLTCAPIPKCSFTISVQKKYKAETAPCNGNYNNYYGSVPLLKISF